MDVQIRINNFRLVYQEKKIEYKLKNKNYRIELWVLSHKLILNYLNKNNRFYKKCQWICEYIINIICMLYKFR